MQVLTAAPVRFHAAAPRVAKVKDASKTKSLARKAALRNFARAGYHSHALLLLLCCAAAAQPALRRPPRRPTSCSLRRWPTSLASARRSLRWARAHALSCVCARRMAAWGCRQLLRRLKLRTLRVWLTLGLRILGPNGIKVRKVKCKIGGELAPNNETERRRTAF